jgi:hypothetical protein
MDALLGQAVTEVALEGRAGCSPSALWQRLGGLPDALKPFLWRQLRGMPEQIAFTTRGILEG